MFSTKQKLYAGTVSINNLVMALPGEGQEIFEIF